MVVPLAPSADAPSSASGAMDFDPWQFGHLPHYHACQARLGILSAPHPGMGAGRGMFGGRFGRNSRRSGRQFSVAGVATRSGADSDRGILPDRPGRPAVPGGMGHVTGCRCRGGHPALFGFEHSCHDSAVIASAGPTWADVLLALSLALVCVFLGRLPALSGI